MFDLTFLMGGTVSSFSRHLSKVKVEISLSDTSAEERENVHSMGHKLEAN